MNDEITAKGRILPKGGPDFSHSAFDMNNLEGIGATDLSNYIDFKEKEIQAAEDFLGPVEAETNAIELKMSRERVRLLELKEIREKGGSTLKTLNRQLRIMQRRYWNVKKTENI